MLNREIFLHNCYFFGAIIHLKRCFLVSDSKDAQIQLEIGDSFPVLVTKHLRDNQDHSYKVLQELGRVPSAPNDRPITGDSLN